MMVLHANVLLLVRSCVSISASSVVVSELLEPEVDIACAIDVLDLLGTELVLPNVGLFVDRVTDTVDLSIESFLNFFLGVNRPGLLQLGA